jgi:hypothetical protein
MKTWLSLLSPLLVWLCHFTGIYLSAEFAPSLLTVLVPVLTAAALAALGVFFLKASSNNAWLNVVVRGSAMVSGVAVVWQAFPLYV